MTLVHRSASGTTRGDVARLVECPACGADLTDGDGNPRGGRAIRKHISEHDPEDFGL